MSQRKKEKKKGKKNKKSQILIFTFAKDLPCMFLAFFFFFFPSTHQPIDPDTRVDGSMGRWVPG